mmetsp:Transcript_6640/g.17118  ORF Transcript_6640/g.17118 Transcript_6640/m.17118 type:complete len:533 (-) Transcript_6640:98-1696(-)
MDWARQAMARRDSGDVNDKTHLSNPLIAATDSDPGAPAVPISSARSRKSFEAEAEVRASPKEEATLTRRYNSARRNGHSDNYGVGYIDEEETFKDSKPDPEGEAARGPAHEDSIYNVMSHNFGKAKAQIIRNDSATTAGQSLAKAYMSMRGGEEEKKKPVRPNLDPAAATRATKAAAAEEEGEFDLFEEVGQVDRLHLITEEEHRENMALISEYDLSVWDYSKRELASMAWSMYHDAGLIEAFQIPADKFHNFVFAIFAASHEVPYHNHHHFFAVLHTSWLFLKTNPIIRDNLAKTDVLGCLTGAIGHDADHPGLTNSFLSATKHFLSVRYNDLSILENHHCATTYTILNRAECNIFCNLSEADWKATRNVIVSAILNTDMARHFNLVANFVKMFKNKTAYECVANRNLRNQIVSMVVHCADISNPVKPWFIAKRFADSVAQEFRDQVAREKASGVPCTPHMLGLDKKGQAKMELGFIDVFTFPAIVALNSVLPSLDPCFTHMEQNREYWQDIMEQSAHSSQGSRGSRGSTN